MATASPGEVRAAALRDGLLVDYAVERPGGAPAVGDVYRGRVITRVPAMAGSFVALGEPLDGFLPDSAGGAPVGDGAVLAVRVTRAPQGGKGPRLAAVADAPRPQGEPRRLQRGPGAVARLAALHPAAPIAVDDSALLAALRVGFGSRVGLVHDAFDAATAEQVEALGDRHVALPGGGRMSIEPTAALVAIDVDLGAAASGRARKAAAHAAANATATREVARHIRLRALAGAIVVDFAGSTPRGRQRLASDIVAHLAEDPAGPRFLGFTALGLAEILRPRADAPLHELLGSAHGAGLAALRALARVVAAAPERPPALWAAPDVAAAIRGDAVALHELAARCGRALVLEAAPSLPPRSWSLHAP